MSFVPLLSCVHFSIHRYTYWQSLESLRCKQQLSSSKSTSTTSATGSPLCLRFIRVRCSISLCLFCGSHANFLRSCAIWKTQCCTPCLIDSRLEAVAHDSGKALKPRALRQNFLDFRVLHFYLIIYIPFINCAFSLQVCWRSSSTLYVNFRRITYVLASIWIPNPDNYKKCLNRLTICPQRWSSILQVKTNIHTCRIPRIYRLL